MLYLGADRGQDASKCLLLVRRSYPKHWAATVSLKVLLAPARELETAGSLSPERHSEVAKERATTRPAYRS
jgi:hypothetical protein